MSEWEYYVETINTEYVPDKDGNIENSPSGDLIILDMLRTYGKDGWEAVAFVPAAPGNHFKGHPPKNPWVFYVVFKRPA